MRRALGYFLILFTFVFIGAGRVKAVNISVSSGSVNVGKSVTLDVTDVVTTNEYSLSFEDGYFEVSESTCGNRSSIKANCKMKLTALSSLSLSQDKQVVFMLKETAQNEETKKATVTIKANNATTTTKPTTTTTTTASVAKSGDATLKTLTINTDKGEQVALSPVFNSGVYEYSATVGADVSTININATMNDSKSNMIISNNASEELKAGENNRIIITVTAEDTTKKAYVINVKREALTADATLSSLKIKEVSKFDFKTDVYKYTVKVGKDVKELNFDYVTADPNAVVTITGNDDIKDGSKVKILVTAQDGTKKEYTIIISKETETTKSSINNISEERNPLIIMALSIVAFGLIGSIIYVIKK